MIFSIYVWSVGALLSAILGTIALLSSLILGKEVINSFATLWARMLCRVARVKVEIIGEENIDLNHPQIFISNHQGFFDIFALIGYIRIPLTWIAKKSLFKIPIIGLGMKRGGHIAIDRTNFKKATASLNNAAKCIQGGKSIVIFPEGTRTMDGSLGRFKKGSLFLIIKAGVPVVPITITGSFDVLRKGRISVHPGTIKVTIDKPIKTDGMNPEQEKNLLNSIQGTIESNLVKAS